MNQKKNINIKKILENCNPNKIVDVVEKTLDFNEQQKGKGLPSDLTRVAHVSDRKHIKILNPKQMLQILPIAPEQVRAGNTSENLLNEIKQIIYSLHRAKEITKKVYNNIMNSIKSSNRRDTILVNSENIKISDLHRLLLNLSDNTN